MKAALRVYYTTFDSAFFNLPSVVRRGIEAKIDDMGKRLDSFPHHRLTGSSRCRLRAGDDRSIYTFDTIQGVIHPQAVGPRRQIYKDP